MLQLTLPAPAKLNLFLHITGRRPDGYHPANLSSSCWSTADTLHFQTHLGTDGHIRSFPRPAGRPLEQQPDCPGRPSTSSTPAALSWAPISGLEKHLPMGGGIGGGSSDAATTLLALNRSGTGLLPTR
jgi:4-diphosphocytidyl-2-C-methyl-D-erythritol kinase